MAMDYIDDRAFEAGVYFTDMDRWSRVVLGRWRTLAYEADGTR